MDIIDEWTPQCDVEEIVEEGGEPEADVVKARHYVGDVEELVVWELLGQGDEAGYNRPYLVHWAHWKYISLFKSFN